jgi:parallel beta-helix repeat protein
MMALAASMGAPAAARTIYVRTAGDDTADGLSPQTALRTIRAAAARTLPDDRVVVGPGTYAEGSIMPAAFGRVSFIADRRGTEVHEPPGNVVLDASGMAAGFILNHNLMATIDGFVIYGAGIGIYVKSGSDHALLSNNIVSQCTQNGIYVQDSRNVLVFNNLVYNNQRTGILVSGQLVGSANVRIVNNTVYANQNRGIFFSGTTVGSPGGVVANNIVQGNTPAGIEVDAVCQPGYLSAGNVYADRFASGTPHDVTDIGADPLFVDPVGADGVLGGGGFADDDFLLSQVAAGQAVTSPAINAGADLARRLKLDRATTTPFGRPDTGWVDAGYHYRNFSRGPLNAQWTLRYATLFVDPTQGADSNDGSSAAHALRTIAHALQLAQPGNRIFLLPGVFREGDLMPLTSGRAGRDLLIEAAPGAAIDAHGFTDGLLISGVDHLTLANLDISGAFDAGVEVRKGATEISIRNAHLHANGRGVFVFGDAAANSDVTISDSMIEANDGDGVRQAAGALHVSNTWVRANHGKGVTVVSGSEFVAENVTAAGNLESGLQAVLTNGVSLRDCRVFSNLGNGVTIMDSPAPLLFNDLVYANAQIGIVISGSESGSPEAQVLDSTVFKNVNRGLVIGGSNLMPGSAGATVLRNIFQGNGVAGLQVNQLSLPNYVGDYNLNFDGYGAITPIGLHDLFVDALFVNPAGADSILGGAGAADDDFRLRQRAAGQTVTSPAVDAGGVDVGSAGVFGLTTRSDSVPDTGVADLGYHYPP